MARQELWAALLRNGFLWGRFHTVLIFWWTDTHTHTLMGILKNVCSGCAPYHFYAQKLILKKGNLEVLLLQIIKKPSTLFLQIHQDQVIN